MRDKSHADFIERWAGLVKSRPQKEWRPQFNDFIDAQFDMSQRFRENMEKTREGKKALKRVVEWRKNRKRKIFGNRKSGDK
jgi:hypothetical protein